MCRPVGPIHFGRHRDAQRTRKSVFGVHMISAVALPNGSALEVFTGSDLGSAPSPDGPRCKQRDSGKADVGSALMRKNRKSDNAYTRRSSLASESSCFSIRRWWLDVRQSFSSGKRANVSTAENDKRGKVCERRRLCVLSFVCAVCITFNLLTAEKGATLSH